MAISTNLSVLPFHRCEAVYDDLFLPPFSPWSSKAEKGRKSRAGGLLFDSEEEERWDGIPPPTHISERNNCTMDLAQGGVVIYCNLPQLSVVEPMQQLYGGDIVMVHRYHEVTRGNIRYLGLRIGGLLVVSCFVAPGYCKRHMSDHER